LLNGVSYGSTNHARFRQYKQQNKFNHYLIYSFELRPIFEKKLKQLKRSQLKIRCHQNPNQSLITFRGHNAYLYKVKSISA